MANAKHTQDLTGQIFGVLTVVRRVTSARYWKKGISNWVCLCECGKDVEISSFNLVEGHRKSCGCVAMKLAAENLKTHGRTGTPTFKTWGSMLARCRDNKNTKYHNYGGRGISVCEHWHDFSNFYADMGERPSPKHSIDRIDVNGNYEPSNCRWATREQQGRNKRNNRLITINGRTQCTAEWAEESGVSRNTIELRMKRGISGADLISSAPVLRPTDRNIMITYRGETKALTEWAEEMNWPRSVFYNRLRQGKKGDALFAPRQVRRPSSQSKLP